MGAHTHVTAEEYKAIITRSKDVVTMVAQGWLMATTPLYLPDHKRKVGAGSIINIPRLDGTQYQLDQFHAQEAVAVIPLVPIWLSVVIDTLAAQLIVLYDIGKASNLLHKNVPEMEFFRHIRNALGHGGNFNLVGKEPINPARFRNFEITRDLNGKPCMFGFLWPGDLLDLMDRIAELV